MFKKVGAIYPIAGASFIKDPDQWVAFRKTASAGNKEAMQKDNEGDKNWDSKLVAKVDLGKFVYVHTTIMASVDVEKQGSHYLKPGTEKYINDNGDCWERSQLLKDYPTFKTANVFVEHVQDPEKAKGDVVDAIARDMGDTVLVDLLFRVAKRYDDLCFNIDNGICNAVSMGCSTAFTKCTKCGNLARNENEYCEHVKNEKNQIVTGDDGRKLRVAELCYDNTFFDCSVVANPAFAGAVFRHLLSSNSLDNNIMANVLNKKQNLQAAEFMKAASKEQQFLGQMLDGRTVMKSEHGIEIVSNGPIVINGHRFESPDDGQLQLLVKQAAHPVENTETEKHDYSIEPDDFEPTESHEEPRHNVLPEFNEQNEVPVPTYSRPDRWSTHKFECPKCNEKQTKMAAMAKAIDDGKEKGCYTCIKCGNAISLKETVEEIRKVSRRENKIFDIQKLASEYDEHRKNDKLSKDDEESFLLFTCSKEMGENVKSKLFRELRKKGYTLSIANNIRAANVYKQANPYNKWYKIYSNLPAGKKVKIALEDIEEVKDMIDPMKIMSIGHERLSSARIHLQRIANRIMVENKDLTADETKANIWYALAAPEQGALGIHEASLWIGKVDFIPRNDLDNIKVFEMENSGLEDL